MFGIEGNAFAAIALLGYIPVAFILFAIFPPRKAVIYDFLGAWLFLPMSHLPLHGFTDLNKMSVACVGSILAALIYDSGTVFAFRPKLWDIPMFIWCVCPFISSMGNKLGPYDALSATAYQITAWGLPYFIGRIYFNDLAGLRELAIGIVIGGLIYVPLCWFEIRLSPQLHRWVYGYHQHDFSQTERSNSYRPMVFMEHGLAVAMWMGTAGLTAFWLWRAKVINKIMGMTMGWVTLILIGTTLCLHSLGAQCLMLLGMGVLWITTATKSRVWILLLTLIPPTWITVRTLNLWDGKNDVIPFLEQHDKRAAESMSVRFHSERVLSAKAMKQPIYGWTAWHFFTQKEVRTQRGVPDQMWIIAFGHTGLIGLISMTATLLIPLWILASRIPVQYWKLASVAPPAALGMLVTLHMCDNLFNAMVNPIFIICAGGLTALNFRFASSTQPMRHQPHKTAQNPALPFGTGAAPA